VKILIDTNVILDIALERKPFNRFAEKIVEASNFEHFHLYISASTVTDIYYVLRKQLGKPNALTFLQDLFVSVDICKVNKKSILQALSSNFSDFEDAVQYYSALDSGIEMIVTRNASDFLGSAVPITDPQDFVRDYLSIAE
jgi:predicted nucleic acid-binding protein